MGTCASSNSTVHVQDKALDRAHPVGAQSRSTTVTASNVLVVEAISDTEDGDDPQHSPGAANGHVKGLSAPPSLYQFDEDSPLQPSSSAPRQPVDMNSVFESQNSAGTPKMSEVGTASAPDLFSGRKRTPKAVRSAPNSASEDEDEALNEVPSLPLRTQSHRIGGSEFHLSKKNPRQLSRRSSRQLRMLAQSKHIAKETVHTKEAKISGMLGESEDEMTDSDEESKAPPKKQERSVNQYVIHEQLGAGAFGKVYRCTDKDNDHAVYAVKVLNKSFLKRKRVGRFGNMLQHVQREVAIWKKLKHPHVVQLFEVIDDPEHDHLYLINEFVGGGAVLPDEDEVDPLPHAEVQLYFAQMVDAIAFLHFERIVHRDIKPGNLLKDADGVLKIGDFGVSQMWEGEDDSFRNTAGTAAFMSPEMTTGKSFSGKGVDTWAAGITLYMMLYGKVPFTGQNQLLLYKNIQETEPEFPDTKFGPIPADAKDVIQKLLIKDPDQRPTFEDIKLHPYISEYHVVEQTPLPDAPVEVTAEEIEQAFSGVYSVTAIVRARRLSLQMLQRARKRLQQHAHEVAMQQWFFGGLVEQEKAAKARVANLRTHTTANSTDAADELPGSARSKPSPRAAAGLPDRYALGSSSQRSVSPGGPSVSQRRRGR